MRRVVLWFLLGCGTLLLHCINITSSWGIVVMYVSRFVFVAVTTAGLLQLLHVPKVHKEIVCALLHVLSVLLACFYVLLTLDTFLFHAWTWFPGLLRYPIYDGYGIEIVIGIVVGILNYVHASEK